MADINFKDLKVGENYINGEGRTCTKTSHNAYEVNVLKILFPKREYITQKFEYIYLDIIPETDKLIIERQKVEMVMPEISFTMIHTDK